MSCVSSRDNAFCVSRYVASRYSAASTVARCFVSSSASHVSVSSVLANRIARFRRTYSSASTLTARAASSGSADWKPTLTRWLFGTGVTRTRERMAVARASGLWGAAGDGGSRLADPPMVRRSEAVTAR